MKGHKMVCDLRAKMEKKMEKRKPVQSFRYGAIEAAIWANDTGNGTIYNVTFARRYKDGEEWKSSDFFGRDDLLVLAKLADQAHSWIYENK
jgi:hypothetical protein